MITYKCLKCGEIFDETELEVKSWRECRGEYWGSPAYEIMYEYYCPYCKSTNFDEYFEEEEE